MHQQAHEDMGSSDASNMPKHSKTVTNHQGLNQRNLPPARNMQGGRFFHEAKYWVAAFMSHTSTEKQKVSCCNATEKSTPL
jgi:hypothetical protein